MSLRDQLLQTGVATKKQYHQAKVQKKQKNKNKSKEQHVTEPKEKLHQSRQEQTAKDRILNQQKEAALAKKALKSQLKQLIESQEVQRERGNTIYRFTHHCRIKSLYFSESQLKEIIRGRLVIVALEEDHYHLIPPALVARVEEKNSNAIIVNNQHTQSEVPETPTTHEDPYADYAIPDDLMW